MKKFFSSFGRLFLAAVICSLFFASTTEAKPEGTKKDLQAYEEAMLTPAKSKTAIFNEYFLFFTPMAQCEMDFNGLTGENDTLKLAGKFGLWFTDQSGNTTETKIPFYVSQKEKDMTIYFNVGDSWKKIEAPSIAAVTADIVATPNQNDLEEIFSMVKSVKVLSETPNYRTMVVHLDGNEIANSLKEETEKNPADKSTIGKADEQDQFFKYLDQGLRNSDIWYTWTIDKKDWQTITLSLNLSDVTQKTAQVALNDKKQQWDDVTRALLETLAFYSDIKSYTVFYNPDAEKLVEIPEEVLNAPTADDLLGNPAN